MSITSKQTLFELKLLYAEDDKSVQEIMKKILSNRFKDIICVCDGQEALEIYSQECIDLMIIDMDMPRLNGLDFCRIVRESNDDIPIMMLTAFNQTEYLIEALQIGIDRFLFKPIKTSTLDKQLKTLVKRAFLLKNEALNGVAI